MAFYIDGLILTDAPSISKLRQSKSVNATDHSFHGRDFVEVEVTSMKSKELQLTIEVCKETTEVQYLVSNVDGLMDRLTPLHLKSDEHILYDGSKDVFVVIKDYTVDWSTGTTANELRARINLACFVIGTPGNVLGKFAVRSQTRNGDFNGGIAGRSTVGIPYFVSVIPNANIDALENRNGTLMLDLGNVSNGFADDTTAALAEEVNVGIATFRLDTVDNNYAKNAIEVYDLGHTPKLRVVSRGHEFTGDIEVLSDQYRVLFDFGLEEVHLFAATGLKTFDPTAFEIITPSSMDFAYVTMNKDEIFRVQLASGDFVEVERGKDPVYHLIHPALQFSLTNATTDGDTSVLTDTNWLETSIDVFVSSNYHFDNTTGVITGTSSDCDQVFAFTYYTGAYAGDGRNREILKEIS